MESPVEQPKLLNVVKKMQKYDQKTDNTSMLVQIHKSYLPGMGKKRIKKLFAKEAFQLMKTLEIDEHQLNEIQDCFKLFDQHGRGTIQGEELQQAALSVGKEFSDEDIRLIILEADENATAATGEIDFLNFVMLFAKNMKLPLLEADIQNVFNVFDHNGDSFISPEEMHKTFLALGVDLSREEVNQIFKKHDHDLKGLLSYQDLKPIIEDVNQQISPHTLVEEEEINEHHEMKKNKTAGGFGE